MERQRIVVGDVVASAAPLLLQTLLGSCVAVCLYDPVAAIGGMNHILLPGDREDKRNSRFGANAMELLINAVMRCGGERRRLVAKAFGAANVLAGLRSPTCGDLNAVFVREYLSVERIPLLAHRLGGTHAVQVHFRTDTGKAVVRTVDGSRFSAVLKSESVYRNSHCDDGSFTGEVTLF
jgi:chemotaxis receptor (MCP) glutamine deamidase CheD